MFLDSLVEDVIIIILGHLGPRDLTILRQVCRAGRALSHSRIAWLTILKTHLHRLKILPGAYGHLIPIWTSRELEAFTRRSIAFAEWLQVPDPVPCAVYRSLPSLHTRLTWLGLVHGRWLFGGSSDRYLRVWDIRSEVHSPTVPNLLAEWLCTGVIFSGKVYIPADDEPVLLFVDAIAETPSVHVLSFLVPSFGSLRSDQTTHALLRKSRHVGLSCVLAVDSEYMLCGHLNYGPSLNLVRWETGSVVHLAEERSDIFKCLDACIANGAVFILKHDSLRVYILSSSSAPASTLPCSQVIPFGTTVLKARIVLPRQNLPFIHRATGEDAIIIVIRTDDRITSHRLKITLPSSMDTVDTANYTLEDSALTVHHIGFVGCLSVDVSDQRILICGARTAYTDNPVMTVLTKRSESERSKGQLIAGKVPVFQTDSYAAVDLKVEGVEEARVTVFDESFGTLVLAAPRGTHLWVVHCV